MNFDKTKEYNEFILPKLIEIKQECLMRKIPFFFTACVSNTEADSKYVKELYSNLANDFDLKKDYFPEFLKVMLGFKPQLPSIDEKEMVFIDDMV